MSEGSSERLTLEAAARAITSKPDGVARGLLLAVARWAIETLPEPHDQECNERLGRLERWQSLGTGVGALLGAADRPEQLAMEVRQGADSWMNEALKALDPALGGGLLESSYLIVKEVDAGRSRRKPTPAHRARAREYSELRRQAQAQLPACVQAARGARRGASLSQAVVYVRRAYALMTVARTLRSCAGACSEARALDILEHFATSLGQRRALEILTRLLDEGEGAGPDEEEPGEDLPQLSSGEAILRVRVEDFDLSVRTRNAVREAGVESLGDLVRKTAADLLSLKGVGKAALGEIEQMLAAKDLRLSGGD